LTVSASAVVDANIVDRFLATDGSACDSDYPNFFSSINREFQFSQ
jgi:hypothetical protein